MIKENGLYAILGIGVILLFWVGYSALQTGNAPASQGVYQQPVLQSIPSECGDINDPQNIQHLSHHPDRFQECYKYVDPQKFKDAVGDDISNFMR